jgi:hypothetical protein
MTSRQYYIAVTYRERVRPSLNVLFIKSLHKSCGLYESSAILPPYLHQDLQPLAATPSCYLLLQFVHEILLAFIVHPFLLEHSSNDNDNDKNNTVFYEE